MMNQVSLVCFLVDDFRLVIHSFGLSRFLRKSNAAPWLPSTTRVLAASALVPPEQSCEGNALFRVLPFGTFRCFLENPFSRQNHRLPHNSRRHLCLPQRADKSGGW